MFFYNSLVFLQKIRRLHASNKGFCYSEQT